MALVSHIPNPENRAPSDATVAVVETVDSDGNEVPLADETVDSDCNMKVLVRGTVDSD